jgi:preprotein translocase subunit SecD
MLAVVGGCGFDVRVAGQAEGGPTVVPPHRGTPTPDPSAPHHKVQVRLFVADKYHSSALLSSNTGMDGIKDANTAGSVWQDPALATDPAAQPHAADTMNCFQDNPMRGQDDPKLPLATCAPDRKLAVLAPTQGGTVWVKLTPTGGRIVAETAPKNIDLLLTGRWCRR